MMPDLVNILIVQGKMLMATLQTRRIAFFPIGTLTEFQHGKYSGLISEQALNHLSVITALWLQRMYIEIPSFVSDI